MRLKEITELLSPMERKEFKSLPPSVEIVSVTEDNRLTGCPSDWIIEPPIHRRKKLCVWKK